MGQASLPDLITVGHIRPQVGWGLREHAHRDQHELIVVLSGRLAVRFGDGQEVVAQAGEVLFYPAGLSHEEQAIGEALLETRFVAWRVGPDDRAQHLSRHQPDHRGRVAQLIRWLSEVGVTRDNDERAATLLVLLAEAGRTGENAGDHDPVKAAQALVEQRIAQTLTLDDLASASGLSRYHLIRRFHAATGLTPMRYVQRCRVEAAKALMLRSPMPLKQVAPQVGFRDVYQLSRAFQRVEGQSPGRWRNGQSC